MLDGTWILLGAVIWGLGIFALLIFFKGAAKANAQDPLERDAEADERFVTRARRPGVSRETWERGF